MKDELAVASPHICPALIFLAVLVAAIAALVFLTACGVAPAADEVEQAPAASGDNTDGNTEGNAASRSARTESPGGTYPKNIEPQALIGLCKPLDDPGSIAQEGVMRGHKQFYNEVDGIFELVDEEYVETSYDAENDIRVVLEDRYGSNFLEIRVADGIEYQQYTIDGNKGEWTMVSVDDQEPGDSNPPGPGEGSGGPSGPVGQADDLQDEQTDTIWDDFSADLVTAATDYGVEMLDGVEVRHVELVIDAASYSNIYSDDHEYIVEYWVDPQGMTVQAKESEVYPEGAHSLEGWPGRRRIDILWTIPDGEPGPITAPEVSATEAGQ